MEQPEEEETTAGISERCHFSFVCCQGLLTPARRVTGVNLSRAERHVSSTEVEAVPAHWHPCPCPCPSPESAMCLQTLALLSCFQACRTRAPRSTSSRALRSQVVNAMKWDGSCIPCNFQARHAVGYMTFPAHIHACVMPRSLSPEALTSQTSQLCSVARGARVDYTE